MLPKPQRLNLKKDFKWVASGKKLETKLLKLFVRTGNNKIPLVGIATSGRVFQKSSQRNRARRLVSAAFEILYPSLPNQVNIIALPKLGVTSVKSSDVLSDLERVLRNEEIIN
ncbi:ribonuclease P protein component [Candidatus Daviesbacteria bacterium]|nr:ribonuclease P protein component [Candidatus Daviesbacteria bacterium]